MTPSRFANALVATLASVLPAGFTARADGAVIHLDAADGQGASASLAHLDPGEADADDYADAAWNVLSMAQDVITETTDEAWPASAGADLPEPGTRVDGRMVHLFFGPEERPLVTLPPVSLDG